MLPIHILTGETAMLNRRALLITSVAVPFAGAARAAGADTALAFVEQLGRDLIAVVNGAGSVADKQAGLEKIIDRDVDVAVVARFCLGRFWRSATLDQQRDYTASFRKVLVKNITGKVGEYQGVTLVVGKAQAREEDIAVASIVTRPNNAPSKVDWIVNAAAGAPKVVDVVAEGTSLRLTQRSDYAAFMSRNNNDIQALIEAIHKQASQPG